MNTMAAHSVAVFDGVVVEEQLVFTLMELSRACAADGDQLLALVHEGVLDASGDEAQGWRFSGHALPRARTALRLARELDIGVAGAAVVMDLLDQVQELRAQLRHLRASDGPR